MAKPGGEAGARDAVLALLGAPGLRTWVAIVAAAVAAGTAGYMVLEGWSFLDALYMTVISVTTVGFKEVRELDASGRIWTMIMSGTGVVLVFGTVGLVTEYLILEATSGRSRTRRMAKAVGALSGRYVLCGYGRVGSTDAALSHGELSFSLEELHVTPDGGLDGETVAGLRVRGLFVLAILTDDGGYAANPADERRLAVGETIIASGSAEAFRSAHSDDGSAGARR